MATDEYVTEYDWISYRLEDLQPETTYCVNIVTSSICEWTDSQPSKTIEFTTGENIRIAERIVGRSKKIGVENGLNLYQVPLTKTARRCKMAERFVFESNGEIGKSMGDLHFTILLVGSCGCGKESLINDFINYIFNVDVTDPFRFQLIDPSGEENGVRVYNIHHSKGFRFNYSLTIIDTPNFYEENPKKNKIIAKTIRKFLKDKHGIQKVNLVGLVLDSSASYLEPINLYIYCFLISLFGEDMKTNVNFLFTSAENEKQLLWNDVVEAELVKDNQNYHKFVSSLLTCYVKNFENFFCFLLQNAKSILFSKQLIDEKKRLRETVKPLIGRIRMGVANLKRLKKTKRFLAANLTGVEFQLVYNVLKKVALPFGEFVTNCTECKMTCHPNCGLTDNLYDCNVMDHSMEENIRTCRVCPKKCLWNVHANESFKWINKGENQTVSLNLLKRNYDTTKDLTWQEFANNLKADLDEAKWNVVDLIETVLEFVIKVNAIAKQKDQTSTPQCCCSVLSITSYLDSLVLSEEEVARRDQDVDWIKKLKVLSHNPYGVVPGWNEAAEDESLLGGDFAPATIHSVESALQNRRTNCWI